MMIVVDTLNLSQCYLYFSLLSFVMVVIKATCARPCIVMMEVVSPPSDFNCVSLPVKLFTDGVGCLLLLELPLFRVVDVPFT